MKTNKICILNKEKGFWKLHGETTYKINIIELYELIKDKNFEIVIGEHNDFEGKWENIK